MDDIMHQRMKDAIEELIKKAIKCSDSSQALQFTQAASNVAVALCTLANVSQLQK